MSLKRSFSGECISKDGKENANGFIETNDDLRASIADFMNGSPTEDQSDASGTEVERPRKSSLHRRSSLVDLSAVTKWPDPATNSGEWWTSATEGIMKKFAYKNRLLLIQRAADSAFLSIRSEEKSEFIRGVEILAKLADDVWRVEKIGSELIIDLCNYFKRSGNLDLIVRMFVEDKWTIRTKLGELLLAYLSEDNRDYVKEMDSFNDFLKSVITYSTNDEKEHRVRIGLGLLEPFLKINSFWCQSFVDLGGLDLLLDVCKKNFQQETLLNAAVDLSNLALFGDSEIKRAIVEKQVQCWLFALANRNDIGLRYYSCLAISILASEKSLENRVSESRTLEIVDCFCKEFTPEVASQLDTKFRYGRNRDWLAHLLPALSSSREEVQTCVAFQFAMEATVRKGTDSIKVFDEISAVEPLRNVASCPYNETASEFAAQVLEAIGKPSPHRLSQAVPLWTPEDVHFWVTQIGFENVADKFLEHRVDGDMLLKASEEHLINDIGMKSYFDRMRFIRELNSLKSSADYSALDHSELDLWLIQLDKQFGVYTFQMVDAGVDRKTLIHLNEPLLKNECAIVNGIHRMKILNAIQDVKHVDDLDVAVLRKHVDIFICYRRCSGSQLASLLKVHLQLRGYKVFIDVDRLAAGQFDTNLLKNVRAAKHFLLVLTPHALDRCVDDTECKDWVHIEIREALASGRNIVPVQDKNFEWPEAYRLPTDIRPICYFNAVHWVHEYQEACVEKLDKFLKGQSELASDEMDEKLEPSPQPSKLSTMLSLISGRSVDINSAERRMSD